MACTTIHYLRPAADNSKKPAGRPCRTEGRARWWATNHTMGCSVVHYPLAVAICSDNSKKRAERAAEGDPRLTHSHLMPDDSKKRGALGWCGLCSPAAVHALNGAAGGPRSPGVTPRPKGSRSAEAGDQPGAPPLLRGLGPEGALAG